jgi:hypothetical protein
LRLQPNFTNPTLKIYVATTNIQDLIVNKYILSQIITKNETELKNNFNFNFEELAFIDYMIGLHSNEVFGHKKSSFSVMLNSIKSTNNYYA